MEFSNIYTENKQWSSAGARVSRQLAWSNNMRDSRLPFLVAIRILAQAHAIHTATDNNNQEINKRRLDSIFLRYGQMTLLNTLFRWIHGRFINIYEADLAQSIEKKSKSPIPIIYKHFLKAPQKSRFDCDYTD